MKKGSQASCAIALAIVAFGASAQDIVIGARKVAAASASSIQPDLVVGATPKAIAATSDRPVAEAKSGTPRDQQRTWSVELKDVNLANTFQRWAAAAGWRVRWDAAKHVMVEAPDVFSGTFEDAVASQLSSPGIAFSAYPLEVCFYPNTPPLARITRKGEQVKECQ